MSEQSVEHKDGVPWHQRPVPSRFHRCQAQTFGYVRYFTSIERCACGAIRMNGKGWFERNSRRRERLEKAS